jgi:hypothetical protein
MVGVETTPESVRALRDLLNERETLKRVLHDAPNRRSAVLVVRGFLVGG